MHRPGSLLVAPSDPDADHDELRHYACATEVVGTKQLVVGNGDHVSHIARSLEIGSPIREAIATLEPEPDLPLNTPRIAAVIDHDRDAAHIVTVRLQAGRTERLVEPVDLAPEEAIVLYTYGGRANLPTGSAPRFRFRLPAMQVPPERLWQALNPDHRVMLAAGSAGSAEPTRTLP